MPDHWTQRGKIIRAVVAGVCYEIPEMWLVGACRTRTVYEALQLWHEQAVAAGV